MRHIRSFLTAALLTSTVRAASKAVATTVPKVTEDSVENEANYTAPYFPLLGFEPYEGNPILSPSKERNWESAYLYNPTASVIDDKVWLLYRAQNSSKVSTIGLAWSDDGYNFTRYHEPVMVPTEPYELPGGCEDPRVIRVNGTFYMTYTGFDNKTARLCMATSKDLINWEKHGPILPTIRDVWFDAAKPQTPYVPRSEWSKSGAIINEVINGVYYMQFGEGFLYTANSTDLIHWNYEPFPEPYAQRVHVWEQYLMESAGPPVKTRDGKWLKIYNGVGTGMGNYKFAQYSTGQLLIDPYEKPYGPPIARLEVPLLQPSSIHELEGQVNNVVFSEGMVQFRGKWFMYFGQGDQHLGVATTDVQP